MRHLSQAPLSILYFFRVRRNICKFLGLLTPTIFHFQNVKGITLHVSPRIQSLSGVYRIVLSCHISADHDQCICSYGMGLTYTRQPFMYSRFNIEATGNSVENLPKEDGK